MTDVYTPADLPAKIPLPSGDAKRSGRSRS